MLLEPYVRFSYFYLSSGNRVVAYWERAAHSAYDMFFKYKYLIVNLNFPPRLLKWEFLIAHFLDHCLLVPFNIKLCFY